jgi:hypothetical protein
MTSSAFPDDSQQTPEAQKGNRPARGARQITAAEAFGPNGLLQEPAGDFLGLSEELPRIEIANAPPPPAPEPELVFDARRPAQQESTAPAELVAAGPAARARGGRPKWLPLALIGVGVSALAGVAVPFLGSRDATLPSKEPPAVQAPELAARTKTPKPVRTAAGTSVPAPAVPTATSAPLAGTDNAVVKLAAAADAAVAADLQASAARSPESDSASGEPANPPTLEFAPPAFATSGEFGGAAFDAQPSAPAAALPEPDAPVVATSADVTSAATVTSPPAATSAPAVGSAPVAVSGPVVVSAPVGVSAPVVVAAPVAPSLPVAPSATPPSAAAAGSAPSPAAVAATNLEGVTLVWASVEIPHEHIAKAERLQTPNVGSVRVVTLENEVFEGRLLSVGQGKVWLQIDPLGKLAFDASTIRELSRPEVAAKGAPKEGFAIGSWVRAKTEGGTLYGKLISFDATQATLMLENGARISVTGAPLEVARAPLSKEAPAKTKVQKPRAAPKPKAK